MIQPVTITTNVWEVGAVKTGAKFCSRVRKESVSSMGQLPCLGDFSETKTVCQEIARKPTCFFAQSPLFQKCETKTTTKVFASPRPPSKPSRADCNATRSSPSMKFSSNLNRSNELGSRTIRVANQDEIITGDFPLHDKRRGCGLLAAARVGPGGDRALDQGCVWFADEAAWKAYLAWHEVTRERYVRIATEGALLGSLIAHGVSPEMGVLSDGAGQ